MAKKMHKETEEMYCNFCGNSGTDICKKCTEVFNEEIQAYLEPTKYEHVHVKTKTSKPKCTKCEFYTTPAFEAPCCDCISGNGNSNKFIEKLKKDNVNHPSHYADSTSIECIESMEIAFGKEAVFYFAMCNAYKYLWRHKNKGKVEEDLNKANWYYHKAKRLANPFEIDKLDSLKFYIDDYACRASVQLKEVHFDGEAV